MVVRGFPIEIANIIAGYATPMRLVPWIMSNDMINIRFLAGNPNAIGASIGPEFGGDINLDDIRWRTLDSVLQNPNDLVGRWFVKHNQLLNTALWILPLSRNTSPWAGEIVNQWITEITERGLDWTDEMDWYGLCLNPAPWAEALLSKHTSGIRNTICSNPSDLAILYMQERIDTGDGNDLDYYEMNKNPHPWAIHMVDSLGIRNPYKTSGNPNPRLIEYIRTSAIAGTTDPEALAMNPNIFEQRMDEVASVRDEISRCEI